MSPGTISKETLTAEFTSAAKEAINESEYLSRDKAERIIEQELSKADFKDEDEENLDSELLDDGTEEQFTDEELEEVLPSDLYAAVRAYLNEIEDRDRYLAEQEGELGKALTKDLEETERQQQARAQAVAEGDAEVPLNEATSLYSDEEGE